MPWLREINPRSIPTNKADMPKPEPLIVTVLPLPSLSGLARDRLGSGNTVTISGSGFGISALLVGIERGFISRNQGIERLLKILDFLSTQADRFHGAFPHFMNGETGQVIPFSQHDDGGDLVETS